MSLFLKFKGYFILFKKIIECLEQWSKMKQEKENMLLKTNEELKNDFFGDPDNDKTNRKVLPLFFLVFIII